MAWYNLDSRIDRSISDLQALASLLMLTGKLDSGSGLALTTSQCNHAGMRIAGFDSRLLPGGTAAASGDMQREVGAVWQTDLSRVAGGSGHSVARLLREDRLRAGFVFGENPTRDAALAEQIDKLEFLLVADLFLTETAQRADVFLPLSSYLETSGHLTNWAGKRHQITPIGDSPTGMSTGQMIRRLAERLGHEINLESDAQVCDEIEFLRRMAPANGEFSSPGGKAAFVTYSDIVQTTPASAPDVIEIEARMTTRMKGHQGLIQAAVARRSNAHGRWRSVAPLSAAVSPSEAELVPSPTVSRTAASLSAPSPLPPQTERPDAAMAPGRSQEYYGHPRCPEVNP